MHTHTHTHTGARSESGFVHDFIMVILPPELPLDMAAIRKVMECVQERLRVESISLKHRKSPVLLVDGVRPEHLTEEQRTTIDDIGLTVVRQRIRVVGVPVGKYYFKLDFLQEVVNGDAAELVRALVPMEDAQTSCQILCLSAASRVLHLLRTVPPFITYQAAAD